MAQYLGLSALGFNRMMQHWWQWVLAGVLLATSIVGASFMLYTIYTQARKYWLSRKRSSAVPPLVAQYLSTRSTSTSGLAPPSAKAKPKSFGVFLGELAVPPTPDQARLLSQWDMIILDALREGVSDALSSFPCSSTHILGRLDLESLLECVPSSPPPLLVLALRRLTAIIDTTLGEKRGESAFTGILLAGWDTRFAPPIMNALLKHLATLGVDVYLELGPPDFHGAARDLDATHLSGFIVRNATILSDGSKRDYFAMRSLRSFVKTAVAQACLRDFVIGLWETVDNDVMGGAENVVAKRAFAWGRFYSCVVWVGSKAALAEASAALTSSAAQGGPLGAFEWLKGEAVMQAHDVWRGNTTIGPSSSADEDIYSSLEWAIPNLRAKLAVFDYDIESDDGKTGGEVTWVDRFNWRSSINRAQTDPLSFSPRGTNYARLGCFPLGFDCAETHFNELTRSQRHLEGLGLLDTVKPDELHRMGKELHSLHDSVLLGSWAGSAEALAAIKELAIFLCAVTGVEENDDPFRVHIGLDSGFRHSSNVQFWGLYSTDALSGTMSLYISKKAQDLPGTILHTFMSSRRCARSECFMAEIALAEWMGCLTKTEELTPRLVQDIEMLSPAEILLFLQHVALSSYQEKTTLLARIRSFCEYQLIDVPSLTQLRTLNNTAYLRGEISAADLVKSRLAWHRSQFSPSPSPTAAISLFAETTHIIATALRQRNTTQLTAIGTALSKLLHSNVKMISSSADLFALSVFCATRAFALDEVYTEVTDRNPLFNDQPDQAAAFAELFATGSRCESYFDVAPSVLGKLLSDRFRAHYGTRKNQPPPWDDSATVLASAYSAAQIDEDLEAAREPQLPAYRRFTLLSVFAIPALVDILMLTTTGRGLYLSAYMTQVEQQMATFALMIALLLSGAVGTWISCGGSYYLLSMAFSAMNMFVLTRLIAGFAFTLATGLLALVVIGPVKGFYAGLVFFLYLLVLTSYLCLLAVLANYQFPGFTFQSGRVTIVLCIPILLISPILTLWVPKRDSQIYLTVLYGFTLTLLFGARRLGSQWSVWYLKVPTVSDREVLDWYISEKASGDTTVFEGMTDPAALQLARKGLLAEVLKERNRMPWTKSTADATVLRLAKGYNATLFLFHWYCKYANTTLPLPYSSTWNIQIRVAIDVLRRAQSGIRLHNGFIHWRRAGDEVGCGILYFLVALLDKWIELLSGGKLVGLSAATNRTFRMAVGFGLAYYLIGAVILDFKAQPLHELANRIAPLPIRNAKLLREAAINDAKAKRRLYWGTLGKFLCIHVWGLSATAALIWSFENSKEAMTMFFAYVAAYTGLLWYQYSKIFSGPHALKPLLIAVAIGLPTGLIMRHFMPQFTYNSVIALGVATWTAAFLALFKADIGLPRFGDDTVDDKSAAVFHSHGGLGDEAGPSQQGLSELFEAACALPGEYRYRVDPETHPGVEVMAIFMSWNKWSHSKLALDAFPAAKNIIDTTALLWKDGVIRVDLVPTRRLSQSDLKVRALSKSHDNQLHLLVGLDLDLVGDEWVINIRSNCRIIAETLIHAVAEFKLSLPHNHALLAELLVTPDSEEVMDILPIPASIKRQLESSSPAERLTTIQGSYSELLRQLCFDIDCDTEWDNLPSEIRSVLLKRTRGEPCSLTSGQVSWLAKRFGVDDGLDAETYIERCNLGAILAIRIHTYALELGADSTPGDSRSLSLKSEYPPDASPRPAAMEGQFRTGFKALVSWPYHVLGTVTKFFVIALIADPEFQRELDYVLTGKPAVIRWPATFVLSLIWMYAMALQRVVLPLFLFAGRENVKRLSSDMKGMKTVIQKRKIVIESINGPSTAFIRRQPSGFKLYQYSGRHNSRPIPQDLKNLMAINTYTDKLVLTRRQEYVNQTLHNTFTYDYQIPNGGRGSGIRNGRLSKSLSPKVALGRHCIEGVLSGQLIQYDRRGFITSGSALKDGNLVHFKFSYRKNARFEDELLRAEYILPHISVNVSWCAPPARHPERLDRWIPHSKVMEATFVQGADVYESRWTYDHKFHPIILTKLNGQAVDTPPLIQYDWLDVLRKPKGCNIADDNPLFAFNTIKTTFLGRWLNTKTTRISTSRARSHLWKTWKEANEFDGVTARWLDEMALRDDPTLKPYWRARDMGHLDAAEAFLNQHGDGIMASVDIDNEISSWTPLAFKMSDFFNFGQGGDAVINTRTSSTQLRDSSNELHVIATDSGTWPNEGGGVSACRRDMVGNLRTIKWHMVVESANDFGLPKYQIEQNIQSLKVIPLWGLDFLTPTHGIFQNCLDSAVQQKSQNTTDSDIRKNFLPILKALVRGARAIHLTRPILKESTKALVDLNTYFESSRHWSAVWNSKIVQSVWRELWLMEDMDNAKPPSQWFDCEHPTLAQLDQALELWYRYLFIFSIPVPPEIPTVFQASHHCVSAAYGIVCKLRRGCTLQIWDHAISWRETNLYLSSALCFLPPFIRNSLLGLMRLTSVLVLQHADIVLPCADFFNPGWEVEIGTCQGQLEHRRVFRRKVDPVVNGICDMDRFEPIETIKTERPTVTMLSHVWYAKDIKTALLAADVIVNEWGFTDYHLDIYGALDKAPTYSTECQEIIASKSLRENVVLKGSANPVTVLADTWLFLNSSISEGLPLALGEAALTGAPVVATDVGASLRVLTSPTTGARFSGIVAPNDVYGLARAQINLLALLEEWGVYANDRHGETVPVLSAEGPSKKDVERITRRMYEKGKERRELGMRGREIVRSSFAGDRYLREHEQMLWIGKARATTHGVVRPSTAASAIGVRAQNTVTGLVEKEAVVAVHHASMRPWAIHPHARAPSSMAESSYDPSLSGLQIPVPMAKPGFLEKTVSAESPSGAGRPLLTNGYRWSGMTSGSSSNPMPSSMRSSSTPTDLELGLVGLEGEDGGVVHFIT